MRKTFKKYFIPHEENNYHPHILHTKRALFYSGVFLAMKIIVIGFAALLPLQVFVMPDALKAQQEQIMILTNEIRANKGLAPLEPTELLYTSSQHKAQDMAIKEYFEHQAPDGRGLKDFLGLAGYDYRVAGENLAMGFSDAQRLVDAWVNSPTHYANLIDTDYTQFGLGLETGEYGGLPTVYVAEHFGTPKVAGLALAEEDEIIEEENLEVAAEPLILETEDLIDTTDSVEVVEIENLDEEVVLENEIDNLTSVEEEKLIDPSAANEGRDYVLDMAIESPTDVIGEEKIVPLLVYNRDISRVSFKELDNKTELKAQAYIVGNIDSAVVRVNQYTMELFPTDEPFVYEGKITVFEPVEELFKVITTPSISIRAVNGEVIQDNILWKEVKVVSPTPIEKYTRAKTTLGAITQIFNVSRGIYLGFIILFSIALALKIFIEFHRQHHHVIVQTLLLIGLLVMLFEV